MRGVSASRLRRKHPTAVIRRINLKRNRIFVILIRAKTVERIKINELRIRQNDVIGSETVFRCQIRRLFRREVVARDKLTLIEILHIGKRGVIVVCARERVAVSVEIGRYKLLRRARSFYDRVDHFFHRDADIVNRNAEIVILIG